MVIDGYTCDVIDVSLMMPGVMSVCVRERGERKRQTLPSSFHFSHRRRLRTRLSKGSPLHPYIDPSPLGFTLSISDTPQRE